MALRIPLIGSLLTTSPGGEVGALLEAVDPDAGAIGRLLDALPHEGRLARVRALTPRQQARLYAAAEGGLPVTLEELVPAHVPALTPVRYFGRNTLPAFKLFEKRFYRTRSGAVAGANFSPTAPVAGPGYFCVQEGPRPGELDIDYTRVPSQADGAPAGWPTVVDNDHGTRKLVFGGMIDTLRRVSSHVLIGSAARNGKPLGAYFVLCRQEQAP